MEVRCLSLPPLGANCYLLANGPQGLVLDPGGAPEAVAAACGELGLTPAAILLTHGHFDHVGAVAALAERWGGLAVYCHAADVSDAPGEFTWQKLPTWKPLAEGQTLALAGLELNVLHTPGHSPGSCCFLAGDCLFTGDVLFRGSMGRTDLPGGDDGQMAASLKRLAALPGDYRVYPGHGPATTLDQERARNPYLRGLAP